MAEHAPTPVPDDSPRNSSSWWRRLTDISDEPCAHGLVDDTMSVNRNVISPVVCSTLVV